METRKLKLKPSKLDGSLTPASLDKDNRTVELIFSTGAGVMRTTWDGQVYKESLSMEPGDVDLTRMQNGAPLLDNHQSGDLSNVIGVVVDAEIRNGVGIATVKFADDPKSDEIFRKVSQGIIKNSSIGYKPTKMVDITRDDDTYPHYLVKNYEIYELSLVGIPADAQAQVRSQPNSQPCEVELLTGDHAEIRQRFLKMKENEDTPANVLAERTRALEIRKAVKEAKLEDSLADNYIERGTSIEDAKTNIALFEKYRAEAVQINNRFAPESTQTVRSGSFWSPQYVSVGQDQRDKKRQGFEDALAHRLDHTIAVTDAGKEFYSMDLLRMAEQYIGGRQIGESAYGLSTRVLSQSDFPILLANSASKVAQNRYNLMPRSFMEWTSKGPALKNFKEMSLIRAGDHASLQLKREGGEYQYGSFGEQNETVQLETFGVIHKFTREALIGDDLGQLAQVASEGGVAAARLEESKVYECLTSNPTMGDQNLLFSSAHKNLLSGAAISDTSIGAAMQAHREQTTVDGLDILNVPAAFMVVGPQSEAIARKYLAQIQPDSASNVNPWAGSLKLVVSGKITTNDYYFVSEPRLVPGVQRFYLEGQEAPAFESKVDFQTDSVLLKVRFDMAAAAVDWRGLSYNPNAS